MATCGHASTETFAICRHLCEDPELDHRVRFTGTGKDCIYLCPRCVEVREDIVDACRACRDRLGAAIAFEGEPQILEEASAITAVHRPCGFAWPGFVELHPILGGDRARFIGVTADGTLHAVDLDARTSRVLLQVPGLTEPILRITHDGALAAVASRKGLAGQVLDLAARTALMPLARGDYCHEHTTYPLAFVERAGRTLLAHAIDWNQLALVDPRTGVDVAPRAEPRLDYFHSALDVSPDGAWIVDNGWHWHPYGAVYAWSVDAWLANPGECDDGPTRRQLTGAAYLWDRPVCWLGGSALGVWGLGDDDASMISALRIFDVATGDERDWFHGPSGDLAFDRELFSFGARGLEVWNVARGTRLFADATVEHAAYHPGAKLLVSLATGTVTAVRGAEARYSGRVADLAARIERERAWEDLPVLGDALESEGCADADLLAHCHAPGAHAERCWVLDRIAR